MGCGQSNTQLCTAECKQKATYRTIRYVSMDRRRYQSSELPSLQVCMDRYRFPEVMRQYYHHVTVSQRPLEFVFNKRTGTATKEHVFLFEFRACDKCLVPSAAGYFERKSKGGWTRP